MVNLKCLHVLQDLIDILQNLFDMLQDLIGYFDRSCLVCKGDTESLKTKETMKKICLIYQSTLCLLMA